MKLLEQVRRAIRARHLSPRTGEAYVSWVRRYVRFHGLRNPAELGDAHVRTFLSALANDGAVAPSTHNQAARSLTGP